MLISIGKRLHPYIRSKRSWSWEGREQCAGKIKTRMFKYDRLIATIDSWISYLDEYTIKQLRANPAPGSWSIGQLYVHLIGDSNYYIQQARRAHATNEHATDEHAPEAREMFRNNAFPDIKIEGHPSNAFISNPKDQHELINGLRQLQQDIHQLVDYQRTHAPVGKSEHPGLGYLNTDEWLQLMDMHFRHHLRQKQRIDSYLAQMIIK